MATKSPAAPASADGPPRLQILTQEQQTYFQDTISSLSSNKPISNRNDAKQVPNSDSTADSNKLMSVGTGNGKGVENENPFYYEEHFSLLTFWELFKFFVLGIVLIPLKIFSVFTLFSILWIIAKLGSSFGYDPDKPMSSPRRILELPVRFLARLVLLTFGLWYIPMKGTKAKRSEAPVIIAAPHSSFLDSILVLYLYGRYSGFGKAEVKKTPYYATFSKYMQTIYVERDNQNKKDVALEIYVKRVNGALGIKKGTSDVEKPEEESVEKEHWPYFITFPEGTCTNRRSLIQFKRGAFVPGSPVQCVVMKWWFCFFDPSWTSSSPHRMFKILRLASQLVNFVSVEFMPVYHPTEAEKNDPILYAKNVRQTVAEKLKMKVSEHSYDESFLSREAMKLKMDVKNVVDFEFRNLIEKLPSFSPLNNATEVMPKEHSNHHGLDLATAKRLLRMFAKSERARKRSRLVEKDFAMSLGLPLCKPVIDIFKSFGNTKERRKSKLGTNINFKQFLFGMIYLGQATKSQIDLKKLVAELFEAIKKDTSGSQNSETLTKETLFAYFKGIEFFSKARDNKKVFEGFYRKIDVQGHGVVSEIDVIKYLEGNPEMLGIGLELKALSEKNSAKSNVNPIIENSVPINEANKALVAAANEV